MSNSGPYMIIHDYTNIGLCLLSEIYLIYMTFRSWIYSCLQVTGCHYTDRFILSLSLSWGRWFCCPVLVPLKCEALWWLSQHPCSESTLLMWGQLHSAAAEPPQLLCPMLQLLHAAVTWFYCTSRTASSNKYPCLTQNFLVILNLRIQGACTAVLT
jgi:hypothetical protein